MEPNQQPNFYLQNLQQLLGQHNSGIQPQQVQDGRSSFRNEINQFKGGFHNYGMNMLNNGMKGQTDSLVSKATPPLDLGISNANPVANAAASGAVGGAADAAGMMGGDGFFGRLLGRLFNRGN